MHKRAKLLILLWFAAAYAPLYLDSLLYSAMMQVKFTKMLAWPMLCKRFVKRKFIQFFSKPFCR